MSFITNLDFCICLRVSPQLHTNTTHSFPRDLTPYRTRVYSFTCEEWIDDLVFTNYLPVHIHVNLTPNSFPFSMKLWLSNCAQGPPGNSHIGGYYISYFTPGTALWPMTIFILGSLQAEYNLLFIALWWLPTILSVSVSINLFFWFICGSHFWAGSVSLTSWVSLKKNSLWQQAWSPWMAFLLLRRNQFFLVPEILLSASELLCDVGWHFSYLQDELCFLCQTIYWSFFIWFTEQQLSRSAWQLAIQKDKQGEDKRRERMENLRFSHLVDLWDVTCTKPGLLSRIS